MQISDENLHHVREVMDDVFGASQFIGMIAFKKTSGLGTFGVGSVLDYIIWYGRDRTRTKVRELKEMKREDEQVRNSRFPGWKWEHGSH